MPVTPDLAPGARARVWILLAVTVVVGIATYVVTERLTILAIAAVVLGVLLYLLAGVQLTLSAERKRLRPVMDRALAQLGEDYAVMIDDGGTVLALSEAGSDVLGHSREILVGQRLADIVPLHDTAARVALTELLRFAPSAQGGQLIELPLLAEDGTARRVRFQTHPIDEPEARAARLIALDAELV